MVGVNHISALSQITDAVEALPRGRIGSEAQAQRLYAAVKASVEDNQWTLIERAKHLFRHAPDRVETIENMARLAVEQIDDLTLVDPASGARHTGCRATLFLFGAGGYFDLPLGQQARGDASEKLIRIDAPQARENQGPVDTYIILPWWLDLETLNTLTAQQRRDVLGEIARALRHGHRRIKLSRASQKALRLSRKNAADHERGALRFLLGVRVFSAELGYDDEAMGDAGDLAWWSSQLEVALGLKQPRRWNVISGSTPFPAVVEGLTALANATCLETLVKQFHRIADRVQFRVTPTVSGAVEIHVLDDGNRIDVVERRLHPWEDARDIADHLMTLIEFSRAFPRHAPTCH